MILYLLRILERNHNGILGNLGQHALTAIANVESKDKNVFFRGLDDMVVLFILDPTCKLLEL